MSDTQHLSRTLLALDEVGLPEEAVAEWDLVIVGSGYGGAMAAAQFAGTRVKDPTTGELRRSRVLLLERGQERAPGDFPQTLGELPGQWRMARTGSPQVSGQAEGLFDLRLGDGVMALVANGVGGGSLINAGVLLEPDPTDLRRSDFRRSVQTLQSRGWMTRASRLLGGRVQLRPQEAEQACSFALPGVPLPAKAQALDALHVSPQRPQPLRQSGPNVDIRTHRRLPISVALGEQTNAAGMRLPACAQCGDCMTGCNVGAKNSLDANLLHMAVDAGLKLISGATVVRLHRLPSSPAEGQYADAASMAASSHWALAVVHTREDLRRREAWPRWIRTRRVILAAGTLGSTELLQRSGLFVVPAHAGAGSTVATEQEHRVRANPTQTQSDPRAPASVQRLVFSARLGQGLSCNGDNIGALHRLPTVVNGSAEAHQPWAVRRVGPTITTGLKIQPAGQRPFWLQEFAVPAPLKDLFAEIVTTGQALQDLSTADARDHGGEAPDALDPAAVDEQAMSRTLLVGIIGHDDAQGFAQAAPDRLPGVPAEPGTSTIAWPDARLAPGLDRSWAAVEALLPPIDDPHGPGKDAPASAIPNPLWRPLAPLTAQVLGIPPGPVLTVHPLGGCGLGSTRDDGVVDRWGRVFDGEGQDPRAVLPGLAVLDGAIVPESLGANPSLTIAALALRGSQALRRVWGFQGGRRLGLAAVDVSRPGIARTFSPAREAPSGIAPTPTRIQVVERLTGRIHLDHPNRIPEWADAWILELTLAYHPTPATELMRQLGKAHKVDPASDHSRVRLYRAQDWEDRGLAGLEDIDRHRHAMFEAGVAGQLSVLTREPSTHRQRRWRALRAWLRHRGGRDLVQRFWPTVWERQRAGAPDGQPHPWSLITDAWRLASRAGEARRFEYELRLGTVWRQPEQAALNDPTRGLSSLAPWQSGAELRGHKRLAYVVAGNPWRQLTELQLDQAPGLLLNRPPAVLTLDPRFLARQQLPLLRVVEQADQVHAWFDLSRIGLQWLRLLLHIHLWTFRKPDVGPPDEPSRLPEDVAGLPAKEVTELDLGPDLALGEPVRIRLTRYPRPTQIAKRQPPLVLIHGYSVSGNTFTHASIGTPAAAAFHAQGREVWVIDLRTSTALPSATRPWPMETVAWVDIPAALNHIRRVCGEPVDVLAHCIGCVMLSMALLHRPQDLLDRAQRIDRPLPLSEPALAELARFNGGWDWTRGGNEAAHPVIRRVVLSQKGPLLRYTDSNVLRGWVMQYLRRWLLPDGFQFKPSAQPGLAESLLDRLLASMPYPDEDWRVENPARPWVRTPWTATRHRMDALYGRDFNAAQLEPQTLAAIDALFGPIHLETVSQTIHFTQSDVATDSSGLGVGVHPAGLRRAWAGIPTLLIHGEDNGLADVWTQRLLGAHLGAAGVPVQARTYPGLGHQDVLIGRRSAEVFADIGHFLDEETPQAARTGSTSGDIPAASGSAPSPWQLRPALLGPRLDVDRSEEGLLTLRIAAMPPLTDGLSRLVMLPVSWQMTTQSDAGGQHTSLWSWCPRPEGVGDVDQTGNWPRQWQFMTLGEEPPSAPLGTASRRGKPDWIDGWWIGFLTAQDQTRVTDLDRPWPGLTGKPPWTAGPLAHAPTVASAKANQTALLADAIAALEQLMAVTQDPRSTDAQRRQALAPWQAGLVRADRVAALQAQLTPEPRALHIGLGSCQYPHGPLDAGPAQASLNRMADDAQAGELNLALLMGDQIYADATAGLVDPRTREDRYVIPHERAQAASGLQRLMALAPTVMLADDHELQDNWRHPPEDPAQVDQPYWNGAAQSDVDGRWAYWTYERLRPQNRHQPDRTHGDRPLRLAHLPIFRLDTRLNRSSGIQALGPNPGRPDPDADLLHPSAWAALEDWLSEHPDQPKLVACPSMLLPRRRGSLREPDAWARSDAWDGYPASLSKLLTLLHRMQARRTLFVSGDEHHALACRITLRDGVPDRDLVLWSIHASALYAPLPFANGQPAELSDEPFQTAAGLQVDLQTWNAPAGDGYARLSLAPETPNEAQLEWIKSDGRRQRLRLDLIDPTGCPSAP